jgi:DNA-binding MarR family transcriptional regulator
MDLEDAMRANRAVNKLAKVYRVIQARKLTALGLHPGQDVLIWLLAQEANGMTISQLASRLGVEPPTATRSLIRLEPGGWIRRTPVPGDRRQVRIELTARARRLVPLIEAVWTELAIEAFGDLPARRRQDVVRALESAVERWTPGVDEAVFADGDERTEAEGRGGTR